MHRTAPGRYVAYVGRPPAEDPPDDGPALRLVAGDLSPYAAEVARTIAAAVDGDDAAHVMVVGAGAGGVVAAELAALDRPLPFVVDQVVTAGAPAAQVPRLPGDTRMLALEDRADPVALLGSLVSAGDTNRTTVVFDAAGSSSEGVYVAGARAADAADSADLRAELDRLRELGYLSPYADPPLSVAPSTPTRHFLSLTPRRPVTFCRSHRVDPSPSVARTASATRPTGSASRATFPGRSPRLGRHFLTGRRVSRDTS